MRTSLPTSTSALIWIQREETKTDLHRVIKGRVFVAIYVFRPGTSWFIFHLTGGMASQEWRWERGWRSRPKHFRSRREIMGMIIKQGGKPVRVKLNGWSQTHVTTSRSHEEHAVQPPAAHLLFIYRTVRCWGFERKNGATTQRRPREYEPLVCVFPQSWVRKTERDGDRGRCRVLEERMREKQQHQHQYTERTGNMDAGKTLCRRSRSFFFFFFLPISVCISGESHEQQEVMSLQRKEKTRRCKGWGKTWGGSAQNVCVSPSLSDFISILSTILILFCNH